MKDLVEWLEFSVTTDGEAAEAIIELFNRYGRGGAVVEIPVDCFEYELPGMVPARVVVKTYLHQDDDAGELRQRIEEGLWHLSQILPFAPAQVRLLAEDDWAHAWKKQYHLIRLSRRLVIVPAWEPYEPVPGELVIRLEPGMAFGTGLHPTTRLCLQLLEETVSKDCTVLDVGTGSGVLAIGAARLGAGSVLALDNDPMAASVARDNVESNGVSAQVEVRHGTLAGGLDPQSQPTGDPRRGRLQQLDHGRYNLVVVNILAPVIEGMAKALAERTAPGGRLVASGLIETQEAGVVAALEAQGFELSCRRQEGDWVALVATRM